MREVLNGDRLSLWATNEFSRFIFAGSIITVGRRLLQGLLGLGASLWVSQAVETLRVFCSDVFLPLQVLLDDESSVPKDWLGEPSLGALTVSL